jgi:hypothetical protein
MLLHHLEKKSALVVATTFVNRRQMKTRFSNCCGERCPSFAVYLYLYIHVNI